MVAMGIFPLQGKIPSAEPEIEPGTSWLVVRNSDYQTTSLVINGESTDRNSFTPESKVTVASTALIFMKHEFCTISGHTVYRILSKSDEKCELYAKFHLHLTVKYTFHYTNFHEIHNCSKSLQGNITY
jgi:hypothetical protein